MPELAPSGWVVVFYEISEEDGRADEIVGVKRVHGVFVSKEAAKAHGSAHWNEFGEYDVKELWS